MRERGRDSIEGAKRKVGKGWDKGVKQRERRREGRKDSVEKEGEKAWRKVGVKRENK